MAHFILITTPRSGSTWLGTLLDDHPDISMYGEIFLPHAVPDKYKELRKHDPDKFFQFRQQHKDLRPKATYDYLDHVFKSSEKSVGFKLMAAQLIKHPEIIFYCRKHNIRLVHLNRNTQDRVISYAIAEQRNNFHNLSQTTENNNKIGLDIKMMKALYRKQKLFTNCLNLIVNNASLPKISIEYQQLLENQDDTLAKIYEFLELPNHKPDSQIQKSSAVPYPELIENYDDVAKIFKR